MVSYVGIMCTILRIIDARVTASISLNVNCWLKIKTRRLVNFFLRNKSLSSLRFQKITWYHFTCAWIYLHVYIYIVYIFFFYSPPHWSFPALDLHPWRDSGSALSNFANSSRPGFVIDIFRFWAEHVFVCNNPVFV